VERSSLSSEARQRQQRVPGTHQNLQRQRERKRERQAEYYDGAHGGRRSGYGAGAFML
jgi:hypothetical protein